MGPTGPGAARKGEPRTGTGLFTPPPQLRYEPDGSSCATLPATGEGGLTAFSEALTRAAEAVAAAAVSPLSVKRAMLAALLIDAAVDAAFAASGEDDVLEFRERLAVRSDALALVFGLCALRPDGPRLVTEAVVVPIDDYPTLRTEDFMVSLYNGNTVQRVRIAVGEDRHDVHEVLATALGDLS